SSRHRVKCEQHYAGFVATEAGGESELKGAINFDFAPLADNVVMAKDRVIFRKYDERTKIYAAVSTPNMRPAAMDLLFLCSRQAKQLVPCLLEKKHFGDLLKVQEPSTNRVYYPGITPVALDFFPTILERAHKLNLPINLQCIDPNSLRKEYVLGIGIKVDTEGRRLSDQEIPTDTATPHF
ncbi:MAG: hypothetical protein NTY53_23285, partial [Kiritimatiellaeota bacterium]|nr:hypothetical protein [Kiritimatiellota bacterium]